MTSRIKTAHDLDLAESILRRIDSQEYMNRESNKEFAEIFSLTKDLLGLEDQEIARALHLSRPTIYRWAAGFSSPHPVGRKPVMDYLKGLLEEAVDSM